MTIQREMPKYRCHKEVWALKISHISLTQEGATITPEDDGYAPFAVSAGYMKKHRPVAGGYYVVYQDGYKSFSPRAAFEAGYSRIN